MRHQTTDNVRLVYSELQSTQNLINTLEKELGDQKQPGKVEVNHASSHRAAFILGSAQTFQQWLGRRAHYHPHNNGAYPIIDDDGQVLNITSFTVKPVQGPHSIDKAIPFVSPFFSHEERARLYSQFMMRPAEEFSSKFKTLKRQLTTSLQETHMDAEKRKLIEQSLQNLAFVSTSRPIAKASCLGVISVLIHEDTKTRRFASQKNVLDHFHVSNAPDSILAFTCPHDFFDRKRFGLSYSDIDRYRMNADLRHFEIMLSNNQRGTLITAFANRDIEAGEEICLNYDDPPLKGR